MKFFDEDIQKKLKMNFTSSKSINAMINNLIDIIGLLLILISFSITIMFIWCYFAYFIVVMLVVLFICAIILLLSIDDNEYNEKLAEYSMINDEY